MIVANVDIPTRIFAQTHLTAYVLQHRVNGTVGCTTWQVPQKCFKPNSEGANQVSRDCRQGRPYVPLPEVVAHFNAKIWHSSIVSVRSNYNVITIHFLNPKTHIY